MQPKGQSDILLRPDIHLPGYIIRNFFPPRFQLSMQISRIIPDHSHPYTLWIIHYGSIISHYGSIVKHRTKRGIVQESAVGKSNNLVSITLAAESQITHTYT